MSNELADLSANNWPLTRRHKMNVQSASSRPYLINECEEIVLAVFYLPALDFYIKINSLDNAKGIVTVRSSLKLKTITSESIWTFVNVGSPDKFRRCSI